MVRSASVRRFLLVPFLALAPSACDDAAEATDRAAELHPAAAAAPATEAAGPTAQRRAVVRYDLAAHLARAELREGRTLVMDHGTPGAAKYTLGGWQTRTGAHHDFDGTSALVIPGTIGKVVVPVTEGGPHVLAFRARAFRDGRVTVYVGEQTVAHARLPTDGSFGIVTVELDAATIPPGEHFVQLRSAAAGTAPGAGPAALALDWIRLAPAGEPVRETAPPPPDRIATVEDGERVLALEDGTSLGWHLDVPAGARLRGAVRGNGSLRAVAHRDGVPPRELASVAATADGAPFDLDLGTVAGDVARIDLVAAGGALRVARPAVVTLDGHAAPAELASRPRNVLVYLIDTLRADKLRVYDAQTRVRTPGLDRWLPSATVFERGQTQENWTKPSVATLLSGLMPWEHTATTGEAVVPGSVTLLSEELAADGFHTGAFVANGYVSDKFGFRQGFGTFRNYIREGRRTQAEHVAADVLEWLDARPEDRPFFLYVHTIDPHVPYMPPADVLRTYDPEPYDGPVDFARDRGLLEKIKIGRLRLAPRDRLRLEALYDGEITYHDTHLAAILDGLGRRGLADDTMVVITADHGEELFDHGSVGHGHTVFQELLHVPLLVRVPGLTEGDRRVPDAAGLVDVVPTILDALGRPISEEVTGRSLLPLLRGEADDAPRVAVSGFMNGWRAILIGRHKLVHRTAQHVQIYDLRADPREQSDVAPNRPLAVRWLRGTLGLALAGELSPRRVGMRHSASATDIDPMTDAQLRALGYVGTSRPE